MTGLEEDLLRDYLEEQQTSRTRTPSRSTITEHPLDSRDRAGYWVEFLRRIEEVTTAGLIRPEDLRSLAHAAEQVAQDLGRFDHVMTTSPARFSILPR